MRTLFRNVAVVIAVAAASAFAAPATQPTTRPSEATTAAAFIDAFVAGHNDMLMDRASPQFKASLGKATLDDVRSKTVGDAGKPVGGPDKLLVSVTRRVSGADGKTYEIIATVADGQLAGFFVRLVP